jgi:ubiquinol-cytochrome c reductase cytochrome b subunit
VANPTLKRFFILHFILPIILVAVTIIHLTFLHSGGSSNPLGSYSNFDRLKFFPRFIFKDLVGMFLILGPLGMTIFFYPNILGHPDNYINANAMITPKHIIPEFYFLPFYAILRAVPNKLLGVIVMFSSLLILFLLPFLGTVKVKGYKFSKLGQFFYWCFVSNFIFLGWLGSCVVEQPYIILSQVSTIFYFSYFFIILPFLGLVEIPKVTRKIMREEFFLTQEEI